ncbi:MAG: GNAT family N-acetyltransferase [Tidjanibacter sp.]|nr:GNAT family N-acetyltransferase [Tidjanibacter sp.]
MNHTFDIKILTSASEQAASELNELLLSLDPTPRPPLTAERLAEVVAAPNTTLFVAQSEGVIVGSLTLLYYQSPLNNKYWIEDVVTSPTQRGRGIGRALVEAAITHARTHHPSATLMLTSNPSRTAARNLYRSVGFEEYNTGVFRLTIK